MNTCYPQVKQYLAFSPQNLHSALGTAVRSTPVPALATLFLLLSNLPLPSSSPPSTCVQNHVFILLKLLKNKHHQQHCTNDLYSPLGAKLIQGFVQELPKSSILPVIKALRGQSCEWQSPRAGAGCALLPLVLSNLQFHSPNVMR